MNVINQTITVGGREVSVETGKLARQADGAVVVRCGGTVLLATVVSNKRIDTSLSFLPLTVDYRERFSAAGRFPGGFMKREARPSETEILTSRLVDRALRPLFPKDYHAETQMLITLISTDGEVMPDALACFAASSALAISDIPFAEPISEARVARIDGKMQVNPTKSELEAADLDIMVAATNTHVVMVEGEMDEVSEEEMLEAISVAHEAIKEQCAFQLELAKAKGAPTEKRTYETGDTDQDLREQVIKACYQPCYDLAKKGTGKHERSAGFDAIFEDFKGTLSEEVLADKGSLLGEYFHEAQKNAVRDVVLNEGIRLDGRKTDEIRAIYTEVDYLPNVHGSAVFTRGETQSLTSITLGTKMDEQMIDGVMRQGSEKFILHYNFPPFSTGEARPIRGVSRREVGHGNLAQRALKGMVPKGEENPYTIRVVSDILESNGSSSMATVCAGSMALMDAGIKMKKPVSGIAMGLILDQESGKYAVLSDILGDEDHLGDMDFKVTGTKDGITACQMDIKVGGLSFEIMKNALNQAKQGREHILGEMSKSISTAREEYKDFVPRIEQMTIDKEFIGAVIGPGGKIIQDIQATSGATVTIDEVDDKGVIDISAANKESIEMAKNRIKGIVAMPEEGETYMGTVKSIQPYGAFVEILPGKDGLLHISEIDHKRIENVSDVLKEGEPVQVKLIHIDSKTGKLKLSRKVLIEKPAKEGQEG